MVVLKDKQGLESLFSGSSLSPLEQGVYRLVGESYRHGDSLSSTYRRFLTHLPYTSEHPYFWEQSRSTRHTIFLSGVCWLAERGIVEYNGNV